MGHRNVGLRQAAIGAAGGLALFVALITLGFGSPRAFLCYLQGRSLEITPGSIDIGVGQSGEVRRVPLTATNNSAEAITIAGAKVDCSCVEVSGLPMVVLPGKCVEVGVGVRFKPDETTFIREIRFYATCPGQSEFAVQIAGTVAGTEVSLPASERSATGLEQPGDSPE
jgi:hypothetical protein